MSKDNVIMDIGLVLKEVCPVIVLSKLQVGLDNPDKSGVAKVSEI